MDVFRLTSKTVFQITLLISFCLTSLQAFAKLDSAVKSIGFSVIKTAESSGTLEAIVVDSGSWFKIRRLVQTAVLVRHPKGDFLWDSGIGSDVESQMSVFSAFESQLFSINDVNPARQQLEAQNYSINKLMSIIPSHMHWDHISALEDFAGTPIWVQENSYTEAKMGEAPAFVASQFDRSDLVWKMLELTNKPFMGFQKSLDIYNDGSAVLVDLSGHSHGHLGLFITLSGGEQFFFIGDTTWTIKGVEDNKSRPWITDAFVGVDTDFEQNAQVIDAIHQLSKQNPKLVVVPAHDELQLKNLPNFPTFKH